MKLGAILRCALLAASCASCPSCARQDIVVIAADPGDLLVVAIGDAAGHVRSVERLATDGSQASLHLEENDSAYWWRVPKAQITGAGGERYQGTITARLASKDVPGGSCGRCR